MINILATKTGAVLPSHSNKIIQQEQAITSASVHKKRKRNINATIAE